MVRNKAAARYFTTLHDGIEERVYATTIAYNKKDAQFEFEHALKRKINLSDISKE